jgi:phosphoglucosamine mutase
LGKQLFGTDGIRGVAGESPLDRTTVYAFGIALGRDIVAAGGHTEILIGADTRESGPWIAALVAAGLASQGVRVCYAGVITTPGVAYLTRTGPFAAGVMISASHNPYQDNGLKVFGHSGFKLPDDEEHLIEQEIFRLLSSPDPRPTGALASPAPDPDSLTPDPDYARRYLDYLLAGATTRLDGVRLVIDCGNGASFQLAPELFAELGAQVESICCQPNGRNINLDCGALHLEPLQAAVVKGGADFGVAFDGDADRAIFVSAAGKVINGDGVLLATARALKADGRLPGDLVVSTVMANLGLEKALEESGIRMLRTPVGDKYVLEEMVRLGATLGGEQSGHVIFRDYSTTGDGMLTALRLFEIARRDGMGLDELTQDLKIYPQRLVNVRVREKKDLAQLPSVASEIRLVEEAFGGAGRVLVRYSGTEPLARVMVEGPDLAQVESFSARIADAIRREMGV